MPPGDASAGVVAAVRGLCGWEAAMAQVAGDAGSATCAKREAGGVAKRKVLPDAPPLFLEGERGCNPEAA